MDVGLQMVFASYGWSNVSDEQVWDEWLDPTFHDLRRLESWLCPAPEDWLEVYPVNSGVNSPKHNDAELLTPRDDEPATLLTLPDPR